MIRCRKCGRIFSEGQVVLVSEDPSPRGIHLPPGIEHYAYCPGCGDDDLDFDFSLLDEIDIEEGVDETEVHISFNGKVVNLYVGEDGVLQLGGLRNNEPRPMDASDEERRRATA